GDDEDQEEHGDDRFDPAVEVVPQAGAADAVGEPLGGVADGVAGLADGGGQGLEVAPGQRPRGEVGDSGGAGRGAGDEGLAIGAPGTTTKATKTAVTATTAAEPQARPRISARVSFCAATSSAETCTGPPSSGLLPRSRRSTMKDVTPQPVRVIRTVEAIMNHQ